MEYGSLPLAQMTITLALDTDGDRQIYIACPDGLHPDAFDGISMCEQTKHLFVTGEIFDLEEAGGDDE